MEKFPLCGFCMGRFSEGPASIAAGDAECRICRGAMGEAGGLIELAVSSAQDFEWETFSVSSTFPKDVFLREEELADFAGPGHFTSIKNSANALLAAGISKATGKRNSQREGDAVFEFDFKKLSARARPSSLYVFGHYLKFSRSHCQSRWHCSDCGGKGCESCGGSGRNYPSIEDELGGPVAAAFNAEEFTLHASGREDVDVRALGSGRPFVLELRNPKKRVADLAGVEKRLSENKNVSAIGLKMVRKRFLDSVCNSHFDKEYSALVSASRPFGSQDAKKIESLAGKTIFQQTPNRVLSRRADMERKRKILSISAKPDGKGKLRIHLLAEAGTYIKELVSSDGGRTRPSVSELLSCNAVCEGLDVVCIRDYFLKTVRID